MIRLMTQRREIKDGKPSMPETDGRLLKLSDELAITSVIACNTAALLFLEKSQKPAIPHIGAKDLFSLRLWPGLRRPPSKEVCPG